MNLLRLGDNLLIEIAFPNQSTISTEVHTILIHWGVIKWPGFGSKLHQHATSNCNM